MHTFSGLTRQNVYRVMLTSGSGGVEHLRERSPSTIHRRRPGEDS